MSFSDEKQNEDRRNSTLRWVVLALCCLSTVKKIKLFTY